MTVMAWFRRHLRTQQAETKAVIRGPSDDPTLTDEELIARRVARFCVRGGPNGRESLSAAREEYVQQGGTPLPHRPPTEAT
jgi:hypothetical protein